MYYFKHVVNQTAIKWVSDSLLLTASSSAPRVTLWNVEGQIQNKYLYEVERGKEAAASQANKLEMVRERKVLMAGCEDGFVRLFDMISGKVIKKLQARGAVSSVMEWDWSLLAGDHSGCLSVWDSRTFKLIEQREGVHLTKYDCGITSLGRSGQCLLSGGADGLVKIFI